MRARRSIATGLALCGSLALGFAVVLPLAMRSSPQRSATEPALRRVDALRASVALDAHGLLGPTPRGAERAAARAGRADCAPARDADRGTGGAIGELEAGDLEVVVRGLHRTAPAWVVVQRIESNDVATPFDPSRTTAASVEDGVARFSDLPRGVLLVGVHVGEDPAHRATWANSRVRGARLEFDLGSASVRGWVRDPGGAPVAGARVRITARHGTVVATSAADGSYQGGGRLAPGRYTVQVEGHPIAASFPPRRVDLQAGALRDVSFGPGGDLSRWTGRVLAPDGLPVTAADGLASGGVQLVARSGRGAVVDVRIVDGRVDQWFERGLYALRSGSSADGRTSRARLADEVDALANDPELLDLSFDLERDVQLAGFVLSGRVELPPTGAPSISLRGPCALGETRATIAPDGTFRFVGLEPATYELRWAADRRESVTIDLHGPFTVEIDLPPPAAAAVAPRSPPHVAPTKAERGLAGRRRQAARPPRRPAARALTIPPQPTVRASVLFRVATENRPI